MNRRGWNMLELHRHNTRSFAVRQEAEESDSSVELDSVDYRNEASQKGGNGGTWRIFIDFLG